MDPNLIFQQLFINPSNKNELTLFVQNTLEHMPDVIHYYLITTNTTPGERKQIVVLARGNCCHDKQTMLSTLINQFPGSCQSFFDIRLMTNDEQNYRFRNIFIDTNHNHNNNNNNTISRNTRYMLRSLPFVHSFSITTTEAGDSKVNINVYRTTNGVHQSTNEACQKLIQLFRCSLRSHFQINFIEKPTPKSNKSKHTSNSSKNNNVVVVVVNDYSSDHLEKGLSYLRAFHDYVNKHISIIPLVLNTDEFVEYIKSPELGGEMYGQQLKNNQGGLIAILNTGSHWTLLSIDCVRKQAYIYDSNYNSSNTKHQKQLEKISKHIAPAFHVFCENLQWNSIGFGVQNDQTSCGVFVLEFVHSIIMSQNCAIDNSFVKQINIQEAIVKWSKIVA